MTREASPAAHATPAVEPGSGDERTLHPEQVRSWRENGFALVDGVFPAELIERGRAESAPLFPAPGSRESEAVTDYGSGGVMEFPTPSDASNEIKSSVISWTSMLESFSLSRQSRIWPVDQSISSTESP